MFTASLEVSNALFRQDLNTQLVFEFTKNGKV